MEIIPDFWAIQATMPKRAKLLGIGIWLLSDARSSRFPDVFPNSGYEESTHKGNKV